MKVNHSIYPSLFSNNRSALILLSRTDLSIIDINSASIQLFSISKKELIQPDIARIVSLELLNKIKFSKIEISEKVMELGISYSKNKKGEEISIESYIQEVKSEFTNDLLLTCVNVSEETELHQNQLNSSVQLRALFNKLEKVQEEERNRISREIHDELGQVLTALKIRIALFGRKFTRLSVDEIDDELIDIMVYINNTIKSVKKIATELRPVIMDELGFEDAIRWYVADFSKKSAIKYKLNFNPIEIRLSDDLAFTAYRLIQESLTNVARHSNALQVLINIKSENNLLKIKIADNGVGMNIESQSSNNSLGILGMKERVNSVNGKIKFSNAKKGGTRINIDLPLK